MTSDQIIQYLHHVYCTVWTMKNHDYCLNTCFVQICSKWKAHCTWLLLKVIHTMRLIRVHTDKWHYRLPLNCRHVCAKISPFTNTETRHKYALSLNLCNILHIKTDHREIISTSIEGKGTTHTLGGTYNCALFKC